jgi:hypothetical protein
MGGQKEYFWGYFCEYFTEPRNTFFSEPKCWREGFFLLEKSGLEPENAKCKFTVLPLNYFPVLLHN